jgi:uncharacterized YigZ family protein
MQNICRFALDFIDFMASYKTISAPVSGKYVEKGSRFIAYAKHVQTEKEAQDYIESVGKEHHKARHVCYAYSIGILNERYRVNDDGEPSNTAGLPILSQIRKNDLKYIVVAVVRYFGGVLLGKGGLIHAYGTAVSEALQTSEIIIKTELVTSEINFHISHYTDVIETIKKNKLTLLSEDYDGETCRIQYQTEPELAEKFKELLHHFKSSI